MMNGMKALMVAGLTIASAAWPAVMVREQANSIVEGSFSSGKTGAPPPKPWQCSKSAEAVRVTVETPAGRAETERWVRLVDDSDKLNANIRQTFSPVNSGRFQARVIANKEGGRLFFHLGSGSASKPEERAVQLIIETDGSLVARGEKKVKTSMQIKTGEVYVVRCDFEPVKEGRALRVAAELVEEGSQRSGRVETEVETPPAITTLRLTTTGPDTGADYHVTDLSLVGR
jgi:hypothetical protein